MTPVTTPIRIDSRYNGPPDSANGGYICGRMAEQTQAACVETRLMAPPPLNTDLPVRLENAQWFALHNDQPVARARQAALPAMTVPAPATVEEARQAEKRFSGFVDHPFRAATYAARTGKTGCGCFRAGWTTTARWPARGRRSPRTAMIRGG